MLRDSAAVGLGLTIVKAAGALKIIFLARAFGTSDALDAYLVAFLLPSFASEVVVGSFSNALIPALIALREKRGRAVMERLRANLLSAVVVALTVVSVLLVLTAPLVLRILGADFAPAKLALAQGLFALLLPTLPLSGFSTVWRAALNSEERFTAAAIAPVATPLLTIVLLWVGGSRVTVWMLAIAHLIGFMLELIWLAVAMRRAGLSLMPRWTGWDPDTRGVIFQHLPLVAVAVASNSGILIDQSMAATLAAGSVSTLSYGTKLATVTAGVVGGALSTAALPRFAKLIAAEDWAGLRRTLLRYTRAVLLTVVPGTVALVALSGLIVHFVFQRGAMTTEAADLVTSVQRWALLQLPAAIFAAILLRLISSLHANSLLMRVAAAGLGLNVALDLVLKHYMGLSGIALAGSLVQWATAAYVLTLVKRRVPRAK